MKKNTMMRIASTLLIAVLLTTCALGATFAKYVTEGTGSDTARVAKWGITMSDNGADTFVDNYDTGLLEDTIIVAPGTTGSTTYEVDGTPETAYKITFDGTLTEEVFLKEGTYTYSAPYQNMNIANGDMTADYYPIKYTVAVVNANAAKTTANAAGNYDTLQAALNAIEAMSLEYNAGTECDLVVTLSWAWAFDTQDDKADTVLGNLAVSNTPAVTETLTDGTDYNLDIAYTLVMKVEQLDVAPVVAP